MGRFGRTRGGFTIIFSMNSDALRWTHPMDAEDSISVGGRPAILRRTLRFRPECGFDGGFQPDEINGFGEKRIGPQG